MLKSLSKLNFQSFFGDLSRKAWNKLLNVKVAAIKV